jgi:hypothetical protein
VPGRHDADDERHGSDSKLVQQSVAQQKHLAPAIVRCKGYSALARFALSRSGATLWKMMLLPEVHSGATERRVHAAIARRAGRWRNSCYRLRVAAQVAGGDR